MVVDLSLDAGSFWHPRRKATLSCSLLCSSGDFVARVAALLEHVHLVLLLKETPFPWHHEFKEIFHSVGELLHCI
jgi:hypothetical protein